MMIKEILALLLLTMLKGIFVSLRWNRGKLAKYQEFYRQGTF
ncbi:hypothetical protein C2W64_00200 [Brevibacillus laterosporus]|nr:hypothetical protein C2W64_00200 [Brevibacillus laterosporus]